MKRIGVGLVMVCVAWLVLGGVLGAQGAGRIDAACGFGAPVKPLLYVGEHLGGVRVSAALVVAARGLEGVSSWQGYQSDRPFGYDAATTRPIWWLSWYVVGPAEQVAEQRLYLLRDSADGAYYVLGFDDMSAYSAPDGRHYGVHPCAVYRLR